MVPTRRQFIQSGMAAGAALWLGAAHGAKQTPPPARKYHLSVSLDALEADPELLAIVRQAGVNEVWLSCFYQGQWHRSIEDLKKWKAQAEATGLAVRHITVPLGHPSFSETPPDYMPQDSALPWPRGQRPDGRTHMGVSLHPPITAENVRAVQQIASTAPGIIFLDDDFRLAPSPHDIGGCFCKKHREQFLSRHNLAEQDWKDLLNAIERRDLTPLLRTWLNDTGDELTACFRAQQHALGETAQLGIMVMFLGSEKAGIRLTDYAGVPMRVGELMFDDKSFGHVKGKTDELFSALFHRRFVSPELAYSETTAWPPDGLSAANMAAKLATSTIADIRNTMFMSGLTPFPRTHWETLAPAMSQHGAFHEKLAGHTPRGPFKHFWGEASRWVGDANPFSLFLALGVPFEVVDAIPGDGFVFLADADAKALATGQLTQGGAAVLHRPSAGLMIERVRAAEESLEKLFAFKHEILPQLHAPYIAEDIPVVCAWYPSARSVLLWNCTEQAHQVTLHAGGVRREADLAPLGLALLEDIAWNA